MPIVFSDLDCFMDSDLGYRFKHYAMTCQPGVGKQYLLYTSAFEELLGHNHLKYLLLFYLVIINLLVLSCFAIIVTYISLSRLILIRNDSLFIFIIPKITLCLYVYLSIIHYKYFTLLFQNNSCSDVIIIIIICI